MNNKITLLLLLLITVCLWNCSRETEPDEYYTFEVIEGVRHVHNYKPQWGDEPKVALEFVQKIGGLEVTDENYMFFNPDDIAMDSDGNLYVLDAGNYRIQKFDSQRKYLATFGRKGLGPSEFQMPNDIDVGKDGNIFVYEARSKPFMILLNPQGKELKRFSYEDESGQAFLMLRSGEIARFNNDTKDRLNLIYIFDTNGKKLREFVNATKYEDEAFNYPGNFIKFNIDKKDNIYVCFEHQNRIEKYSPEGKLLMKTDRPLDFEITYEKRKRIIRGGLIPREVINAIISRVSKEIGVDHKERIWAITYRRQREDDDKEKYPDPHVLAEELFRFDIFDPEGIYLGSFPVEKDFDSMHIYDNRLFLIDSGNEMCIYEYKIVEK